MTTWFTSDLHFGHKNIINYCNRPFHSVDNMNKLLVQNYNELVMPGDDVYFLGDIAMGKWIDNIQFVRKLKGNKFLVPGNHDACWSLRKGHGKAAVAYRDVGFTILPEFSVMGFGGRNFAVCHFPYGSGPADPKIGTDALVKNPECRPRDRGMWLLHGHTHSHTKVQGHQINVGVDAWGMYPASLDQILGLIP